MNGITHKQAIQFIHLRLDGMLKADQAVFLDEHLEACESCRTYAQKLGTLPAYLNTQFKERWDTETNIPSHIVQRVNAQARKIPLAQRFSSGVKLLGAVATLALFGLAMNFVISRWQSTSAVANENTTATPSSLGGNTTTGLLAFTSDKDGNSEIYVMNPDGTGLTNLTNDPAHDATPFWSPDGRKIAFTSDRDGTNQIYSMDADGSNITRITHGDGSYGLDVNGFSPWSPDGTRLIVYKAAGEDGSRIYALDVTEKNTTELTNVAGRYLRTSWSPDGTHIAFTVDTGRIPQDLFIVGSDGSGLVRVTENLRLGEYFMFKYGWSQDGSALFFATHHNQQSYSDAAYTSTVYQANVDGSIEVAARSTDRPIFEWSQDMRVRLEWGESLLKWVVADGSESTLKLCENNGETIGTAARRSHAGDWMVGSNCSANGWILYWTNPDGTIVEPLLESVIPVDDDILFDAAWAFDDQHIAFVTFNSTSVDLPGTLYVLNVAKARQDPSTQPLKISNGSHPSWQPISTHEVVEEEPTPEPSETSASHRLVAFTSNQDGNFEIYSMRADGSGLTNLTNHSAQDVSPVWSPDGKQIAFESDRNGFRQIFLMNADGSNVVQLVPDEDDQEANQDIKGDQWIGEPYNLGLNLWSPDGKKLVFLEMAPGNENGILYVIDANGENKKPLVQEAGNYSSPSWSPDGKQIAFIAREGSLYRIYSTDVDGNNLTNVTKKLELNETLYPARYSWSRDGQSISFIASNWNYLLGGPIDSSNHKWTAYEASPDGNTLITNASEHSQIGGYWEGTYFLSGSTTLSASPEYTWVRSDGTLTTVNPVENCGSQGDSTGFSTYKQSSHGNVVIGSYCPNGEKWLFWANSDGIFKPLLNSPLQGISDSNAMHLWAPPDFIWSSDDEHIAFNVFSLGKTEMYIVNTTNALNDPSVPPFHMSIGNGFLYYSPVWQPRVAPEIVKEEPAPEPTPETESKTFPSISTNISNGEWIALIGGTSANSDNFYNPASIPLNQNVFLVHPDGSALTNVTEFNAHYYSLQWSPNGQHLLFMREDSVTGKIDIMRHYAGSTGSSTIARPITDPDLYGYSWSPNSDKIVFADASSGNYDIYTLYADGRNDPKLTQLTSDPGQDVGFVWSPDGGQIAFQRLNGDQLSLYVMNEDGSDQREVARGMGRVKLGWSMDGQSLYANSIYRWENTRYSHLECEGCVVQPSVYKIDLGGPSVQQIYYDEDSNRFFYVYEASQNQLYFLSVEERDASIGLWGTWRYWDGNSIHEIAEMDPHQTCLTTTGSILNEHISPNHRYSIISNYCAGGFDLYLADRETSDPEMKLTHLLRLPLDTWGQGGDGATIPILWSPDGRRLIYNDDRQNTRLLLLNLEKAIHNPDQAITTLLQKEYFTDASGQEFLLQELTVFDLVWQPSP